MSQEIVPTKTSALDIALDTEKSDLLWKMANTMAAAVVSVPEHLQGNTADCYAVALQSAQWGMNPFPVAQKSHLIHGKLGYESQLVNAVLMANAPIQGRLKDEYFGPWENLIGKYTMETSGRGSFAKKTYTNQDEMGCGIRISGVFIGESEPRVLEMHMREAANRNSTLWASNPKQQLFYLATKMWARKYCPDVILGVYTPDEIRAIPVEITEVEVETTAKVEIIATPDELQYIAILASQPAIKAEKKVVNAVERMKDTVLTQEQAQKTTRIFMNLLKKAKAEIPPLPGSAPKVEVKVEPEPQPEPPAEQEKPAAPEFDRAKAMKKFHAKGNELFAGEWDYNRKEIMYGMFAKTSSKDLTDEELIAATDELHRIEARQANQ